MVLRNEMYNNSFAVLQLSRICSLRAQLLKFKCRFRVFTIIQINFTEAGDLSNAFLIGAAVKMIKRMMKTIIKLGIFLWSTLDLKRRINLNKLMQ